MFPLFPCLHTRTGGEFIIAGLKPGFSHLDIDVCGNLDAPNYLATSGSWVCVLAVAPNANFRRGTWSWEVA